MGRQQDTAALKRPLGPTRYKTFVFINFLCAMLQTEIKLWHLFAATVSPRAHPVMTEKCESSVLPG